MSQLSLLDRTMLQYTGVDASAVAEAERVTLDAVRGSRQRLGRRPTDGLPASPLLEQADRHARRARDLQRAGMDTESVQAWGEANYQATLALAELMRSNRSVGL